MPIEYFDKSRIRKDKRELGKARHYALTISEDTYLTLQDHVDQGRGRYGSAVIELGTRLMIALVAEDSTAIDIVFEDLVAGVKSPYFARNLQKLYKMYFQ